MDTTLINAEQFWSKVNKTETCWLWTAYKAHHGYGKFRTKLAHRVAYELTYGPVPDGKSLDHFVCSNPSCVRPDHMRPVEHRENVLRGNGVAAKRAAQTHCVNGHPFDASNTRIHPKHGGRICIACTRGGRFERRGNADKKACVNGHAFDEINTHVSAKGHRTCRKCNARREGERRLRMRIANDAVNTNNTREEKNSYESR